jgi:hypothetical protein
MNKGFLVALSIGIASVLVAGGILLFVFLTKNRGSGTMPYEYINDQSQTYIHFDSGTNLEDIVKNYLPLITSRLGEEMELVQPMLKTIPDLSFLKLSGFVAQNKGEATSDEIAISDSVILGLELSHRTNSENGLRELLDYVKLYGFEVNKDTDGFFTIEKDLLTNAVAYLDYDYLLISNSKENIKNALQIKTGTNITKSGDWSEIKEMLQTREFAFYANMPFEKTSIKLTASSYNQDKEIGLVLKNIGSLKKMIEPLEKEQKDTFEILLKSQKDLGNELAKLPQGKLAVAAFSAGLSAVKNETYGNLKTWIDEGTTIAWMDMDKDQKTTFALQSSSSDGLLQFIESIFPSSSYAKKTENSHTVVNQQMMGEDGIMYSVPEPTAYYTIQGDTLTLASTTDGLTQFKAEGTKTVSTEPAFLYVNFDYGKIISLIPATESYANFFVEMLKQANINVGLKAFEKEDRLYLKLFVTGDFDKLIMSKPE